MNHTKYQPFKSMTAVHTRNWPNNELTKAPLWCSVDLRDGNQALEIPMTLEQKIEFFKFLVEMGFKEIEIGFPAASDTEYGFTRALIEQDIIPDDVTIQVLTQSREHIIRKTFEALEGVKRAVVHLYNSTSILQRDVVFNKNKEEIVEIAVFGAKFIKELADEYGRERFMFEYSPESFTGTETEYALQICNAVLDIWQPTPENKAIINLPSTVEMTMPNIYADQIEFMSNNLKYRDNVIVSLHTHNDRGTAVASTELGLLAGADRVEGTLFGNGERTGNADILNVAMNMYSHGVDPQLNFSKIDDIIEIYERTTGISVHPRHPYAGELVFTAFSGSHQDAINKGMERMKEHPERWEVPYLPIDPVDVGRNYDPIIRINSQSGKGGVAFILNKNYGLQIPKRMQQEFGGVVTRVSDSGSRELKPEEIYELFEKEYINLTSPVSLVSFTEVSGEMESEIEVSATVKINGQEKKISEHGNGLINAFCNAISKELSLEFDILNYSEHSMEYGSKSRAITYMEIADKNGTRYFGAGVSGGISKSSIRAIISAVNKCLREKE